MNYRNGENMIEEAVLPSNHYEKVFPYDSAGVTVTPGDTASWGDTAVLVPIDGIKDDYGWNAGDVCTYNLVGFTYLLDAGASKPNTIQFFRIVKSSAQVLDGNAANGQPVIPVPLTDGFVVGDQVWIVDGDTPAGELREIDSIDPNVSITVTVNLTGDYTTAQGAVVYLIRRKGNSSYRTIWDKFAHADTKTIVRHELHGRRMMDAGDGILVRAYGIEDATGVMLITAIYHET